MSRVVTCPLCKSKGLIPANSSTARIRCTFCRTIFQIDGQAPEPSSVVSNRTAGGVRQPESEWPPSQDAAFDDSEDVRPGYRLRLMSSVKDVSCIPTAGTNLMIVAVANDVLHFRIFDGDGNMVVDTDAKRLPQQAQPIEILRRRLETLWRPHELTEGEKVRVITSVASIVGHTLGPLASVTNSSFHRSPAELSNDSRPAPLIYGLLGASWIAVFVLVAVLMRGGDDPAADDDIGARVAERSHASSSEEEMTAPAAVESPVSPTNLTGSIPGPRIWTPFTVIDGQGIIPTLRDAFADVKRYLGD